MGWLSDHIGRRPLLITSCIGYAVLGYPFFLMAASGSIGLAVVAQLLMVLLYVPYAGACPALYAEIFPTRVRYTALSMGYNIAVAIFGGFAPFIATFLVRVTDNSHAPAVYVITAATSLSSSYCGPARLRLHRCGNRLDRAAALASAATYLGQ
jgi:MFS transporter, MHS family, proline/betaine transporter